MRLEIDTSILQRGTNAICLTLWHRIVFILFILTQNLYTFFYDPRLSLSVSRQSGRDNVKVKKPSEFAKVISGPFTQVTV